MLQAEMFSDLALHTEVISRRKNFDSLFDGFTSMRAVSFVASPALLLEFFEQRGYSHIELVVGDNLSDSYRQNLTGKEEEVERLTRLVESDQLRILTSKRQIHTKLYVLRNSETNRVIQTSANLTETARKASQINYAWYVDLLDGHPFLETVEKDIQAHMKGCAVFMDDLVKLIREHGTTEKKQVIEIWLKGTTADDDDVEYRGILHELSMRSLELNGATESIITVRLPDAPVARRSAQKFLAPLNPTQSNKELSVNEANFIRYVHETHGVPLMHVDMSSQQVRLGINGTVNILTEPLPDAAMVDRALEHVERYLQTVDRGQSTDKLFAKTSMYQALLYVFFAPFASQDMKMRRKAFGLIDSRGPRYLYIVGPSENGKSTFLKFVLKLLTGHFIEPIPGAEFKKDRLKGAQQIGTVIPFIFDDVMTSKIS